MRREEHERVKMLRFMADFACWTLQQGAWELDDALRVVAGVRSAALKMFPGKGETFDLIYGSRFRRILAERYPSFQ